MRKVLIYESCENTIKELQSYAWDERAARAGKEQPIKDNDHTCDALRYFVKTIINSRRWSYGPE
jgi:phage terminase large subunit